MGSEVLIKVTHGEGATRSGNDRDPGGRGDCSALGSVFESWLLERGHVVGCTFVICTSMFCFKQNLARY